MKPKTQRFFLVALFAFFSTSLFAQSSKDSITLKELISKAPIEVLADQNLPQFPGGKTAWQQFVRTNFDTLVPLRNWAKDGQYLVQVLFRIDHTGQTMGFIPETHKGFGLEPELIRVIKKSPLWQPASIKSTGHKVSFVTRQQVIVTVKKHKVTVLPI